MALVFVLFACENVDNSDMQQGRFIPTERVDPISPKDLGLNPQSGSSSPASSSPDSSIDKPIASAVCGDSVCNANENKCTCSVDCGNCEGWVSNLSQWSCVGTDCKLGKVQNLCGNAICESNESTSSCPTDCPNCIDSDLCTTDEFSVVLNRCIHKQITPCCGNSVCEPGESSCLLDCATNTNGTDYDLSKYPLPFVKDLNLNAYLIVGSNGSSRLVIAGIDIVRTLTFRNASVGYSMHAMLDTNISTIQDKNAIIIGNACHNKFTKLLMKPQGSCLDGLTPGHGLIRLYRTGLETYAIVIAGYSEDNVRAAAQILSNYNSTHLTGNERKV